MKPDDELCSDVTWSGIVAGSFIKSGSTFDGEELSHSFLDDCNSPGWQGDRGVSLHLVAGQQILACWKAVACLRGSCGVIEDIVNRVPVGEDSASHDDGKMK